MTYVRRGRSVVQSEAGEVRSSDLYLCAFYAASGQPILRVDEVERGRCHFVFAATPELKALESQWFMDGGEVNAKRYADQVKRLKGMVHGAG